LQMYFKFAVLSPPLPPEGGERGVRPPQRLSDTGHSSARPPRGSQPNQPRARSASPPPNEARFATTIASISRHIERVPSSSRRPNAAQKSRHSATGANVSATIR